MVGVVFAVVVGDVAVVHLFVVVFVCLLLVVVVVVARFGDVVAFRSCCYRCCC